jgi:hypothetical protein
MRKTIAMSATAGAAVLIGGALVQPLLGQRLMAPKLATELRPVASFADIPDTQARSIALFEEAGKVLQHPRCVNCHPVGDRPRQTDRMLPHQPLVVRGKDGNGAPGMACATCHGPANFDPAGVPGDPHWHLAPASMAWEGKSLAQICVQLKDPQRNGNRDLTAILKHVTTDSLVKWGWAPGPGRAPAPGTNAEFVALLDAWIATGAHCAEPWRRRLVN